MKNSDDNVFAGLSAAPGQAALLERFLGHVEQSVHTRRAVINDVRKFVAWFADVNQEQFGFVRVTARDVLDFKEHLRKEKEQAVATINRSLVVLRRVYRWLAEQGHVQTNPVVGVKELRRQQLSPQGLDRSEVRRLLREVEVRNDVRSAALFSLLLYTGARVGDVVGLCLSDLQLHERSGLVVYRTGKGNKERMVPLPLPARRALAAYLEVRPDVDDSQVFLGERGPLTAQGVRNLCTRYGKLVGIDLHPHLLRHTMAHKFLADTNNDIISLAQILGHQNLNTTAVYTRRSIGQLSDAADKLTF